MGGEFTARHHLAVLLGEAAGFVSAGCGVATEDNVGEQFHLQANNAAWVRLEKVRFAVECSLLVSEDRNHPDDQARYAGIHHTSETHP